VDKIGLAGVGPCFNPKHNHKYALESFESMPQLFKRIEQATKKYVPEPFLDICICATPHSPYNMPFYGNASASDPINPTQMRRRVKAEKAIHGSTFAVGDSYQLPADEYSLTGVQQSFESAVGTGAKMTAQYADLDSAEIVLWKKWFDLYKNLGLSSGEYMNYYDIEFDAPEAHVVKKGNDIYYGFFASNWGKNKKIELRGLDKNKSYNVVDYANKKVIGTISSSEPYINYGFKESLLLKASPVIKEY
jgi:alpha-galactosidase